MSDREKSAPGKPGRYAAGRGRSRALYMCAEDLCDAYEESDDAGEGEVCLPRPRRHAVRLVDELDGEATPRRGRPVGASAPQESSVRTEALARTEALPQTKLPASNRRPFPPRGGGTPLTATEEEPVYAILSIRPSGEGETVAVVLSVPGADGAPAERLRLYLLVEQYADLGIRPGPVDKATAEDLLDAGRLCAAVKRGMNLLAYGDQSARRLIYKLTAKGVDRASAEAAAAYLSEKGYIHEDDTARRRAEQDVRKLWGPRRIREDLRANGFTAEAIDEALLSLDGVDFEAQCAAVIRKKYREIPTDYAARQKMTAALMRLGYDGDVIRTAMRAVAAETEV